MQITCPGCHKKLKISENLTRKTVRCPGCKTVLTLPDRGGLAAAEPEPAADVSAPAAPPDAGKVVAAPVVVMRCAKCKAAALQRLPANQFSRNPGYVCSACGATMRRPGTTGLHVFTAGFGVFFTFLSLVLCGLFALNDFENKLEVIVGSLFMAVIGLVVAGWGGRQLLLPVPLDAPSRPSRFLKALAIFLGVIVVGILLIGGCFFGLMYYMHEQ